MSTTGTRTVAGVDIGGTKTRIVLARADDGFVIEDRTVPSTGWQTRSLPDAADWLVARLGTLTAARIAVGAHACETPGQCARLAATVENLLSVPVTIVNDAELLVPAAGFEHGVGVVAGTGAIAVARHRDTGGYLAAGGWGWVLGDEGSASALVREAARTVLGHADEGGAPDLLEKALLTAFDVPGLPELAATMSWDGGVETWGQHAPAVFAAADRGSAQATAVIEAGGRELATLVARVAARGAHTDVVVAGGGVITTQPRLFAAFQRALGERLPDMRAVLLDTPPVQGALALALRAERER